MNAEDESEVLEIIELQKGIKQRLLLLGFSDPDGQIIHHLAELTVWGNKLSQVTMPRFLALSLANKEEMATLVADLNYELTEMKQAIEDMEPTFVQLMNFLGP